MHLIAHSIGWDIDSFTEEIEPVIALEKYSGKSYSVEKGDVTGVRQTGCAVAGGKELLKLIFHAEVGFKHPYDRLIIEGRPPIDMTIKNGINGDISTAAIAVNAIPFVANASAGLKTMADIGPAFYRKM